MWSACTGYKGASDWFIDSNIQLALAASKMVSPAVFEELQNGQSKIHSLNAFQSAQALPFLRICAMPRRSGPTAGRGSTLWSRMVESTTGHTRCKFSEPFPCHSFYGHIEEHSSESGTCLSQVQGSSGGCRWHHHGALEREQQERLQRLQPLRQRPRHRCRQALSVASRESWALQITAHIMSRPFSR